MWGYATVPLKNNFSHLAKSQYEECREKFVRDCLISYRPVTKEKKVEVCAEEVRRDCGDDGEGGDGRRVCSNHYQSGRKSLHSNTRC